MEKLLAVFDDLLVCTTTIQVDNLLLKHGIDEQYHISEAKYPKLQFKITPEEIRALVAANALSSDYKINNSGVSSPMEKLLYALIWKQGDVAKIKHIISGIMSTSDDGIEDAIVFTQFGRHLSGKQHEPIIDQHVLRAFGVYKNRGDKMIIEQFRSLKIINRKHAVLVKEYKSWLNNALTSALREDPDYIFHVDKVLFSLGKYIKH